MSRSLVRLLATLGVFLLATTAWAASPYFQPSQGNRYIAKTAKYLYVIWAVPNDLAPFNGLKSADDLDAFIARTGIYLCKEHLSADPNPATPCKLQVVRMSTNDEYTKSAAGGFKTVATLVLPKQHANAQTLQRALTLSLPDLRALYTRFEVQHDRIGPR